MNDEEFKKKLESILGNLYKIDREVKDYLSKEKPILKNKGYKLEHYKEDDPKPGEHG